MKLSAISNLIILSLFCQTAWGVNICKKAIKLDVVKISDVLSIGTSVKTPQGLKLIIS
ncbi:MAG: hypothetical protein ACK5W9_02890 [Bdellovibrionales bacterium]